MSKRINVAAVSVNQTPLDWTGNRNRIISAIEKSAQDGATVICLPELCLTGYGCEDMFLSPEVGERAWSTLKEIAPHTKNLVVAVGLPIWFQSSVFNGVALLVDGEITGCIGKQNLAGDGIHYETRWFKPWPEGVVDTISHNGIEIPIGDLIFDIDNIRIGFEICEDAWVAERPGVRLARRGIDLILNPSASHFAFGKQLVRERFVLEGSRAFACAYVYSNLLGNESGRIIFDGGTAIASGGNLVATGKRFSFQDFAITAAPIDINVSRMHQARQASHEPILGEDQQNVVKREPGILDRKPFTPCEATQRDRILTKEEEFARAEALGLFDYMRKSWSSGFVLSLSGGADSGAVACLVKLMVDLAVTELGKKGFKQKLHYIDFEKRGFVEALLTCVYQATRNSGEVTRNAAESIASAVGARYQEWDIDELVEGYRSTVEKGIGRKLTWEQDDITLQNIQARVRAPGIWMIANLENALLLATSNRSEAAVGYATMDGDTSGGLSPICGIDKAFLREWLRWLETTGAEGIAPIPELTAINAQAPTAELRPKDQNQTDEGDLMPYPLLDAIEKLAIRDKKLPVEVYQLVCEDWAATYSEEQLKAWVIRFFKLWSRNQWKRERYAPSFHLDDENLDPKTWCRFPILSSGFKLELEELSKL
ncbi:MAG: NAD(+) synthase [Verrucomicrobiales bacterium]|nr:NAD(+) synthase [Verrucomicrobiales bacterium]